METRTWTLFKRIGIVPALVALSGGNRPWGTKWDLETCCCIWIEYQGINFWPCFYWQGVWRFRQQPSIRYYVSLVWMQSPFSVFFLIINPMIRQRSNVHWMLMTDWAVISKVVAEIDALTGRNVLHFLRNSLCKWMFNLVKTDIWNNSLRNLFFFFNGKVYWTFGQILNYFFHFLFFEYHNLIHQALWLI